MQYQKSELSREEATDKILCCALKSRRRLLKHDDDDDVQGAEVGGAKNLRMKNFLIPVMYCHLKIQRALIRKKIQTDKVLDLIANTAPTVPQQAQTPPIAQQVDMYNLRTTVERKPTQKLHLPLITNKRLKRRTRVGVKKEEDAKLRKQKVKRRKKINYKLWQYLQHNFK